MNFLVIEPVYGMEGYSWRLASSHLHFAEAVEAMKQSLNDDRRLVICEDGEMVFVCSLWEPYLVVDVKKEFSVKKSEA